MIDTNWGDDVRNLQKALYNFNMVFGRKNWYSIEHKIKVTEELQRAASKVARWEEFND